MPDSDGPRVYLSDTSMARQLDTTRGYTPDVPLAAEGMTGVRMKMLTSFHYYRDTDMDAMVGAFPTPPEVFADSGGFSAYSMGASVDVHDYSRWLVKWGHLIHVYVALDVIGDGPASEENLRIMEEEHGLHPVPVFHCGEPWDFLVRYCERYPYVALGGMVGQPVAAVLPWLVQAVRIGNEHGTRFHGFGQTRHEVLSAVPLYSVDSSSWGSGHRYGTLTMWDDRRVKWVRISTGSVDVRKHGALVRAHGGDPVLLAAPGCGQIGDSGKTTEQARVERAAIIGVNVGAWVRYEAWLRKRHGVIPAPEGYQLDAGPSLYLADARGGPGVATKTPDLAIAAQGLTTDTGEGPRLYLAEGVSRNLRVAAEHLSGNPTAKW